MENYNDSSIDSCGELCFVFKNEIKESFEMPKYTWHRRLTCCCNKNLVEPGLNCKKTFLQISSNDS